MTENSIQVYGTICDWKWIKIVEHIVKSLNNMSGPLEAEICNPRINIT